MKKYSPIISATTSADSSTDSISVDLAALSLEDNEISMKNLKMGRVVGEGAWGSVRHAKHKNTGKSYAVKTMSKYSLIEQKQADHAKSERDILSSIDHPFLVKLEKFEQDSRRIYMVQEFVNGGEFMTLLRQKKRLDISSGKFFAAQTVLCLEYLHKNNIIYRDLKPENMLVDRDGYLKIIDFGLSKKIDSRTYTICGTPHYIAPEVLKNEGYSFESDWFSFGVFLYETFTGSMPFDGATPIDVFRAIINSEVKFP
mmetsp:Transcript_10880/g.12339  ORF Transcript_10880/g.12339 Transcript_10880/m.12339 type:complete len:256 (+) Transcript_10880:46-813(+)